MKPLFQKISVLIMNAFLFVTITSAQQMESKRANQDKQNKNQIDNYEQNFKRNAEEWSLTLGEKLNLNASQQDSVRSVMVDYQRQRMALGRDINNKQIDEFNSTFSKRIEGFLESNQINGFNSYSRSWWDEINTGVRNIPDSEKNLKQQKRKNGNKNNDNNQNDNRNDEIKRSSSRDKLNPQRT